MASLILSAAGAALGGALFGPVGAIAARIAGAVAGNVIDHALLGGRRSLEGPRLADLDVTASTEGAAIPRVYGRARIGGEVIWATRLEEVVAERGEGGKGLGARTRTTTYSYYANVAVGLAEGPIGRVARVWADGKPVDLSTVTMRVHAGDEAQAADPLIVAKEGAGGAPAYRGLAYVVFERLPLAPYGNRIPQLAFEVMRPVGRLERMVRAVTLIPGATEFGYAPQTVTRVLGLGRSAAENRHVATTPSDVVAALDDLQATCPNLERVAIVVAWFGDDLRAGTCRIRPKVERADKETRPLAWSVAGLTRAEADVVSRVDGRPAYGGTPSDASVAALIAELAARGLKVTLYPLVMMDVPDGNALPDPWTGAAAQPAHPWRGRITCDPAPGRAGSPDGTAAAADEVAAFFAAGGAAGWNYRRFVLHYAGLAAAAGGVDAMLVGSELVGLTRVRSAPGAYPAAAQLAALAVDVKAIVGTGTRVGYGADWTEYGAHVVDAAAQEVGFPLDELWASPAIDAVGVDWYAPLADWRDGDHLDRAVAATTHDRSYLAANLRGGEAHDWYYADAAARAAQARTPITDGLGKPWMFRQKDIWNWWANPHHPRQGGVESPTPTAWVPQSKPIWLTEVGCPAVDKGANQPSVFPDAKSSAGGVPHFSSGARDDLMQRRVLECVLQAFDPAHGATTDDNPVSAVTGERMVAPDFVQVWTWDARPYPVFPAAAAEWSDGANWDTGHWLGGRLGSAPLDGLLAALLADAGVADCDASALGGGPDGYVVDRPMTPRAAIEPLALAYAFDAAADGATLRFRPRGGVPVAELGEDDLVLPDDAPPCTLTRAQETELPRTVTLGFSDGERDYRRAAAASRRLVGGSRRVSHAELAVVASDAEIARRAEIWLQDLWAGREGAEFALPPARLALMPGDVVGLTCGGRRRLVEIREIVDAEARRVTARSIDPAVLERPPAAATRPPPTVPPPAGPVRVELLDLPTLPGDAAAVLTRAAVAADPWPGPVAIWASGDGAAFRLAAVCRAPAVVGDTLDPLPRGPAWVIDRTSRTRVRLTAGALASVSDERLLAGANLAALRRPDGGWEVVQFATATLVGERTFELSRLLRGQAGSERAIADPLPAGAAFVLLDAHVAAVAAGLDALERPLVLRVVAADRDHGDPAAVAATATPSATALAPLAPVHPCARRTADGVHIAWIRRTRVDGDGWAAEPPLGEEREAYEVDVLAGAAIVRTLAAAAPAVLYAAAAELADFGAPQASLSLRIHQLSATVGRGTAAEAVLAVR